MVDKNWIKAASRVFWAEPGAMEPARALFSSAPAQGMRALMESSQWLDGPGTPDAALLLAELSLAHPDLRDALDLDFEEAGIPEPMRFALTRPAVFLKRAGHSVSPSAPEPEQEAPQAPAVTSPAETLPQEVPSPPLPEPANASAEEPCPAPSLPEPQGLPEQAPKPEPEQEQEPKPERTPPAPDPFGLQRELLEEGPFVTRSSRIDLVPKDFSLIDPEPLDALLAAWLDEASRALQELLELGRQRDAARTLASLLTRADRNSRSGTVALWKWANKTLAKSPPQPLTQILQEYKHALLLVVQGHYDGEYGRDGGVGHLALAEFIPWTAAILALPQDKVSHLWDARRGQGIEREWEAARDA